MGLNAGCRKFDAGHELREIYKKELENLVDQTRILLHTL